MPTHRARSGASLGARSLAVSLLAGSTLLSLAAAPAGCEKEPGSPFTCICQYVSESDQASREPFTVCAINAHEANALARSCQNVRTVEGCDCQPAREGSTCRSGCSR